MEEPQGPPNFILRDPLPPPKSYLLKIPKPSRRVATSCELYIQAHEPEGDILQPGHDSHKRGQSKAKQAVEYEQRHIKAFSLQPQKPLVVVVK